MAVKLATAAAELAQEEQTDNVRLVTQDFSCTLAVVLLRSHQASTDAAQGSFSTYRRLLVNPVTPAASPALHKLTGALLVLCRSNLTQLN